MLLSACTDSDNTTDNAKSTHNSGEADTTQRTEKAKTRDRELDDFLLAAPKLSLKEAIKKYLTSKNTGGPRKVDSPTLTQAAIQSLEMGDNDAAEVLLTEALRLDSKNGEAYFQRGRARCNGIHGKDKEAITDLKTAISLGAGGASVHSFLARLYDEHNEQAKAIDELTEAIRIDPVYKQAYKCRAAIYDAIGKKESALKDYQQLSKITPADTGPYFRIAQVFESMGRYDEASATYLKLVSLDETKARIPLKPLSYKRLAAMSSARGQHKEAITYLTKALELDEGDDEPLRLRGQEYAKLKNYEKAIADYTKAIELSPEISLTFQARSEVYEKLGNTALAQKDRIEAKRLSDKPAEKPTYEVHRP